MSESIYLLGAGGHGRVVLETLHQNHIQVKGILDAQLKRGDEVWGVPILGGDNYLDNLSPTKVLLLNGLGANPHIENRRKLFATVKQRGFQFMSLVHPSAILSPRIQVGEGSQIMAGAIVQCGSILGKNIVINTRTSIDHDCTIEDHSFISPGTILCGNIIVERSTFIGAGATILPGLRLGKNSIVGAGAVVIKSIPQNWIVAGNPAIKIGINEK